MPIFIGIVKHVSSTNKELCTRIFLSEGTCPISWKLNLFNGHDPLVKR